ncbi:hypothetical protein BOO91_18870 [Vibrio navarrensis]|nr:hypothetical protein UF06_09670 [Vibrio sp. S234-5]MBE3653321.1 hypothetical protein [Vibrio navarrensis]MBE3656961.1 hypothetical protein [Vibrio navarrensis]MBE3662999.1 hypothetical protein [Vibrio navarrensis]MBE3668327.1 hypothetical protein [Vibrio navarrensis]
MYQIAVILLLSQFVAQFSVCLKETHLEYLKNNIHLSMKIRDYISLILKFYLKIIKLGITNNCVDIVVISVECFDLGENLIFKTP